jgi:hypothetical protein
MMTRWPETKSILAIAAVAAVLVSLYVIIALTIWS